MTSTASGCWCSAPGISATGSPPRSKCSAPRRPSWDAPPARASTAPTSCRICCPAPTSSLVAIPATDETRGLVDAKFLAALPDSAIVANIARGSIVDTDALLAELQAERLSAFLDVTDPEPLPQDHPLWRAPNLIITPHVGGGTHGWERRGYRLVREQLERYVDRRRARERRAARPTRRC